MESHNKEKRLLTRADIAEMLQVKYQTIVKWEEREDFPKPLKLGGAVRFKADEVNAWIDSCQRGE